MNREEIDFSEYEPMPLPNFKSPREMMLYMTGENYKELVNQAGEDFTWEELESIGMHKHILNILMTSTHQPILFIKKS